MPAFAASNSNFKSQNLLYGHGFCEVSRLVHIGALLQRDVIGQQLQRDGVQDRAQVARVFMHLHDVDAVRRVDMRIRVGEHIQFAAARTVTALRLGPWRIATPICYEAIRPDLVRRMVLETDPHLFVTLANDAWFGPLLFVLVFLALSAVGWDLSGLPPEQRKEYEAMTPMRRFGTPEEVAKSKRSITARYLRPYMRSALPR